MLNLETVELVGADGIPFGDFSYYPDNRTEHESQANEPAGRAAFVFTHYPSVIDPDYVPREVSEDSMNLAFQMFGMVEALDA